MIVKAFLPHAVGAHQPPAPTACYQQAASLLKIMISLKASPSPEFWILYTLYSCIDFLNFCMLHPHLIPSFHVDCFVACCLDHLLLYLQVFSPGLVRWWLYTFALFAWFFTTSLFASSLSFLYVHELPCLQISFLFSQAPLHSWQVYSPTRYREWSVNETKMNLPVGLRCYNLWKNLATVPLQAISFSDVKVKLVFQVMGAAI